MYQISTADITDHHKLSCLNQHIFIMSQLRSQMSELALLVSLRWMSQGQN